MISEIVFVNLSLMETKYPICDVTVFFFFSQRSGIQKLFMQYVSVLKDKITIVHIVQVKKKKPEKGIFPYFYESECFSLHLRNSATWFMAGYREHLPVHTYSPWWSLNRPNVLINFSGEFNVSLDNRAMQKTAENLQ